MPAPVGIRRCRCFPTFLYAQSRRSTVVPAADSVAWNRHPVVRSGRACVPSPATGTPYGTSARDSTPFAEEGSFISFVTQLLEGQS